MENKHGNKKIILFFLKFMLTQITILNTFEEFMRIINHLRTDFNYVPLGPYLVKTSMVPEGEGCHLFYKKNADFVSLYGTIITKQNYMSQVQAVIKNEYLYFEVVMVGLTLSMSLVIELISFVSDNQILMILDNVITLLLPHFSLYVNTISWGDLCIQQSPILNVLDFTVMGQIGYFTLSCFLVLLILLALLFGCKVRMNSPLVLIYGFLIGIFICYVIAIDIINIYSSIFIIRVLTVLKLGLMGLQLYTTYSR